MRRTSRANREELAEELQCSGATLVRRFGDGSYGAPVLADCEGRVGDLENLGAAGLEALTYLQSRTAPPPGWKEGNLALINEAEKPDKSILKLSWLPSYRALILAAADVDALKAVTPEQWKQQVMQEAAAAGTAGKVHVVKFVRRGNLT